MKQSLKTTLLLTTALFSSFSHSEVKVPPIETDHKKNITAQKTNVSTTKVATPPTNITQTEHAPQTTSIESSAPTNNTASTESNKELQKELSGIHDELQKLKPWYTALFPGLFALLGIATGGIISFFIQRGQRLHDTTERLKKSGFEAKLKLIEYRSKQVNEFYGPMLVLLKQSKELSMQLHNQLAKDAPQRYKFESDSTSKIGTSLFIHETGQPNYAFRLISELPYLGIHHKPALPRVKVIIDTGERLAKLIEEKSGLVKPSSEVLIACLGTYLAHLTALRDAYSLTQKPKGTAARTHDAVFPREIEDLTRSDYDDFIKQIKDWEDLVDNLLKDPK